MKTAIIHVASLPPYPTFVRQPRSYHLQMVFERTVVPDASASTCLLSLTHPAREIFVCATSTIRTANCRARSMSCALGCPRWIPPIHRSGPTVSHPG